MLGRSLSNSRIAGDFAVVIWDARKRELFCTRDFMGVKPFFYYLDERRFICGSELQQVLNASGIERKPNEGMVGEYLAGAVTHKEETLFESILRLPPAHNLIVRAEGVTKKFYWQANLNKQINYRTDEEYADHFLSLFKEVIQSNLRSDGKISSHLSGGLDSSAIVATAAQLQHEGKIADSGFETFSVVYPKGWDCDEREYINSVASFCGVKTNLLDPGIPIHPHYVAEAKRYLDFPDYPNGCGQWMPIYEKAAAMGFRVMLTGLGGNEWFEGGTLHLADLFRKFKLFSFYKAAKRGSYTKRRSIVASVRFANRSITITTCFNSPYRKKTTQKKRN